MGGKVPSLHCFSPHHSNVLLLHHFILLKSNLFSKNLKNTLLFKRVNHYTRNSLHCITVTASMIVLTSKFCNGYLSEFAPNLSTLIFIISSYNEQILPFQVSGLEVLIFSGIQQHQKPIPFQYCLYQPEKIQTIS